MKQKDNSRRIGLGILIGTLMLVGLMTPVTPTFSFMDEGTIRVGVIRVVTGPASGFGLQFKNGGAIAVEEINRAGGVKIGNKFVKFVMDPYDYDDARNPAQAVALARKLDEQDKVLFILGPQTSASAETVFGSLQKKVDDPKDTGSQIVCFSPAATRPGLADISEWAFRNVFQEEKQIDKELPILIEAYKIKTVGLLVQKDDAYCWGTWELGFKPAIQKYGLKIVDFEECFQGDRDLSPHVSKLKRANPDMWIISALYMTTARALIEAKRMDFNPKIILGDLGTFDPLLVETAREAVEGFIVGSSFYEDAPRAKEIVKRFKEITGFTMNNFGAQGYEAMYMAKLAIENAKIKNIPETLKEDRRKFRGALLKIKNFQGLIGKVDMMPNGDVEREGVILECKGGKFVPWGKPK